MAGPGFTASARSTLLIRTGTVPEQRSNDSVSGAVVAGSAPFLSTRAEGPLLKVPGRHARRRPCFRFAGSAGRNGG
jgi:hypothetical protein